jgi:dephospho-CoA kinase
MKIIGITGGIGSGKSTVAKALHSLGYAIYYADERAKWLMNHDPVLTQGVKELFGAEAYQADGTLNRAYLGSIVFTQPEKLQQLNKLVHPRTGADFLGWVKKQREVGYDRPFLFKEAAILFESGAYRATDAVLGVYSPKTLRLKRVARRDDSSRQATLDRMNKQWPEIEKIRRADYLIYSDERHSLLHQVRDALHYFSTRFP